MGFDWNSNYPSTVYITVGRNGIVNIDGVEFNVDGKFLTNIDKVSVLTDYSDWSSRRFKVSLADFQLIANSKDTKMKVQTINSYTVSSFGTSNSGAVVNNKFQPFLQEIENAIR